MCIVHSTSMTGSTIVAATIDMTVKLGITLPKSILLKIDQRLGDIARSRYIRRAVERYLGSSSKDIDDKDYKGVGAGALMYPSSNSSHLFGSGTTLLAMWLYSYSKLNIPLITMGT